MKDSDPYYKGLKYSEIKGNGLYTQKIPLNAKKIDNATLINLFVGYCCCC